MNDEVEGGGYSQSSAFEDLIPKAICREGHLPTPIKARRMIRGTCVRMNPAAKENTAIAAAPAKKTYSVGDIKAPQSAMKMDIYWGCTNRSTARSI